MAEEGEEHLYLTWTDHSQVLQRVMSALRYKEKFADVTLVCGKKQYAAHKFVLSMCSSYFEELFEFSPCQHPIIVLVGTFSDPIEKLLDFMYLGQTDVHPDNLDALLDVAHELKIKGLTKDHQEGSIEAESEVPKPFIKQEPIEELIQIKEEPTEELIQIKEEPTEELIQIKEEPKEDIVQESTDEIQFEGVSSRDQNFGCSSSKFAKSNTSNKGKRKYTRKKPDNSSYNKKRKVCEETIPAIQMNLTCAKCGESFRSQKDVDCHAFWHVYRFLTCPDCPYKTISYKDLKVHINRHILVRPYTCTYCNERQFNRDLHVTHQQKKHSKEKVIINKRTLEGELQQLRFNIERETLIKNEAPKMYVMAGVKSKVMSVIDETGKKMEKTTINVMSNTIGKVITQEPKINTMSNTRGKATTQETKNNIDSNTRGKATANTKPKPWRISNFCE